MILDEAIKRYTDNAEYERTHGNLQGCLDFKQLAEWLKELKKLREQEPKMGHWIDIMVGEMPAQACDQCNTFYPLAYTGGGHKYCPNCGARMESGKQKGVNDMGLKEVCGNCEHYKRSYDGHCNAEFCCGNEDGENYGVPIFRDDTCDEWKEKDVGETNEIIKSL